MTEVLICFELWALSGKIIIVALDKAGSLLAKIEPVVTS